MKRLLLIVIGFTLSYSIQAQFSQVPFAGGDTSNACAGILTDHAGNSNYSNYADGTFVIDPPGNTTVSLQFNSFITQNYYDVVYVYDGVGTFGTQLGAYSGTSLPNNGNPITSSSGAITVRFVSNYYSTFAGFQCTWSSGGTSKPTASFVPSTTSPVYNTPVLFVNTTLNGGSYLWDFGDGTSSTDQHPSHSYTSAGVKQVKLISTNCIGSDTSTIVNINVQAAPVASISKDTVKLTVACGGSGSTSFDISNTSGGILNYDLALKDTNQTGFVANFEDGTLDGFINKNPSGYTTNIINNNAAIGSNYLELTGNGGFSNGLQANFDPAQPNELSYYFRWDLYGNYNSYIEIGHENTFGTFQKLFYTLMRYDDLRLYYGNSSGGFYYTTEINLIQGSWYHIELKNIDYTAKTYDIYINGTLKLQGAYFIDQSINELNRMDIYHNYNGRVGLDYIKIGSNVSSNITFTPKTGLLASGTNSTILINADASGLNAGKYFMNFEVASNDTSIDGKYVPLILDVTGTAVLTQSTTCFNHGTVYTSVSYTDSVLLTNSGCDTLNFTGFSSTDNDLAAYVSSIDVPPYDSAWLYVTLTPTQIKSYNDTLYLSGPDTNTFVCVTANALGAPDVSTNDTLYTITYNGCPDTITFPITIYNTGNGVLNWSTSSSANFKLTDDFESGALNPNLWDLSKQGSGAYVSSNCGTITGSYSLVFFGSTSTRYAQTKAINTTGGGTIDFILGQGTCETADPGDELYLFYSLDGIYWTSMGMFYTPTIDTISVPIPIGAQGNNVYFKLQQTYSNGNTWDNWLVDDFSISLPYSNSIIFVPDTGNLAANDSIQLQGNIIATDLNTGVHRLGGLIQSNDPDESIYTFDVELTINGIPDLAYAGGCFSHDSTITGYTALDSIMFYNDGCKYLNLQQFTTTLSAFTVIDADSSVAPGDTGYIHVEFSPTVAGLYHDTLVIKSFSGQHYDSICLFSYGVGAPVLDMNTSLISATINSCNDSVTKSVTIKNTGLSKLVYDVLGASDDTLDILMIIEGYGYSNYINLTNGLANNLSKPYRITTTTSSTSTLSSLMEESDIVVIPPTIYGRYSYYTSIATMVQNYLNKGGNLIVCGTGYTSNIWNMNVFNGSYQMQDYGNISLNKSSGYTNHPIFEGVSDPFLSTRKLYYMNITNSNKIQYAYRTSYTHDIITEISYGSGKALYLGFDYFYSSTSSDLIFANSVEYYAKQSFPDYLTVNPDSAGVAVNDSLVVDFKFKSAGLSKGVYTDTIVIGSNDPNNTEVHIPVQLTVNGKAEMTIVPSTCVSFDTSYVGAINVDSVFVFNTGCDTLVIDSSISATNLYNISNLPLTVAPGDSSGLHVQFVPDTIGYFTDTVKVYSNADTVGICVNGGGKGAPKALTTPDTLKLTVNKCDGFKIESFDLENDGQGNLDYSLSVGSIYERTSSKNYSLSQSSTYHYFTDVPVNADTIFFRVVINGDFSDYYDRIRVYVDNYSLGYQYDNDKPDGTYDTVNFYYTGPWLTNWLADSALNIQVRNYGVNANVGLDLHEVTVTVKTTTNWLTLLSSTSGSLSSNSKVSKNIMATVNTLAVGTYESNVIVKSNDPVNPYFLMPVKLDVVDEPGLGIIGNCIHYGLVTSNNPIKDSILVYNDGCKDLNITNLAFSSTDFTSAVTAATVTAGDSLWIPVTFTPSVSGAVNSNFIMYNNDSNVTICLTAQVSFLPIASYNEVITNMCDGQISFTDNSQNNPTSWYWDFGDGNFSTLQNPTHTYQKPGLYTVQLITSNISGSDTASRQVSMNNVLYMNFSMPDSVRAGTPAQFYDSCQVATSLQWYFGDGNSSMQINPLHTYSTPGTYYISLVASNPACSNKTLNRQIVVYSGIGIEEDMFNEVKVYPVPSSDYVNISWEAQLDIELIEVIDAIGNVVEVIEVDGITYKLDALRYAEGMYFLRLENSSGNSAVKKFVIER